MRIIALFLYFFEVCQSVFAPLMTLKVIVLLIENKNGHFVIEDSCLGFVLQDLIKNSTDFCFCLCH
jgi:hypothetical protein